MKKGLLAVAIAIGVASCGNNTSEENTTDSTNVNMGGQAPAGDTSTQINSGAGMQPADTSNQNADDSIKGTSRISRSTTPGNDSGKAGRKQ